MTQTINNTAPRQRAVPRSANDAAALLYQTLADNFTAFVERKVGIGDFPHIEVLDLHDDFWGLTPGYLGTQTNPCVFVPQEKQFRRYNSTTGIYEPIRESVLLGELTSNLDTCAELFPDRVRIESFIALKNRQRLKAVVERAKDLLAVGDVFFKPKPQHLPVQNGILDFTTNQLIPFNSALPLKETLPVKFDPEAKCEVFLKSFLVPVVKADDIDLLQRYLSQLLEGRNHSQTILLLNGASGWGKSTLMKIIGSIFGWNQAGIIREQVFGSAHELSHYQDKRFLFHPDMPTDFLDRQEASLFKQLVGGDPIWTEAKNSDRMMTIEGNFPVVLACNGNPKIKIDCDAEAWLRRLVVVKFGQAFHEQHMGKLGDMIVRTEGPGIVNWLLEGRRKLLQSKLQLTLTKEQRDRAATVLLSSESPKAFVRCCIQKHEGGVILMADLYEQYQRWCRQTGVRASASREFMEETKEEIEIAFGLRPRHDLESGNGKAKRGWSGLTVSNAKADLENVESWSVASE
jgi:P4 family phage/plasmid primase-like protien